MNQPDAPRLKFWQRILQRSSSKPEAQVQISNREHTLRDGVAIVFLSCICLLAILQRMEILAITTIIFIGVIAYKTRVRRAMDIGFELFRRTRVAKVGDVEFTVEQTLKDYSRLLDQQAEWMRVILSDLTSEQISLLIAVYKAGRYEARDKDSLRALRARGLLFHNAPSMTASTEVWLSELGKEIVASLLQASESKSVTSTSQTLIEAE